ncbi:FAD-binding oxidoreductase [Nocardia stercoris]|uniref:FAD-binding oxidoreductase n=1 Tax=Nocardia stercoris TaxID=2483361 RepID=A0A3M2LHF8_9NOCA|nr:FAD-dependent oxidoreductase [Nocardia stercoris]RMI35445.1 FAD-binding oxidoreductase [Nocardia stercoris]
MADREPGGPGLPTASASRRAFLVGAAATALGARTTPASAQPAVSGSASGLDWSGLTQTLRGSLTLPSSAGFGGAVSLFDPRFDGSTPAALVAAADSADVVSAVQFATANHLSVAVRGGGHSYVGASAHSGALIVDTRALNSVTLSGDSATVGAGVGLYPALAALDAAGRSLPVGTCPTVGLAGLTVGGGIGVDSRQYGATCDRLVSAQLVLPGGQLVEVSAQSDPDLFWALQGAGGGLGIVTALTFRTVASASKDIVRLSIPVTDPVKVLTGWAEWAAAAERTSWANLAVRTDNGGIAVDGLVVCAAGAGAATVAALGAAIGTTPTVLDSNTYAPLDAALSLAGGSPTEPRTARIAGSDVLPTLDTATATAIVKVIADRARAGQPGLVLIDPLTGALSDPAPDATAFPWRRHTAMLQWIVESPQDPVAARAWIGTAHAAVAADSVGGYVNYVEPDTTVDRYYAANAARVRLQHNRVDAANSLYWGPGV